MVPQGHQENRLLSIALYIHLLDVPCNKIDFRHCSSQAGNLLASNSESGGHLKEDDTYVYESQTSSRRGYSWR